MRIFRKLAFALALTATLIPVTAAQTTQTLGKNSAERTAILAALRGPVEKGLKQRIVFVVDYLAVKGNWAFVNGEPKTPSGVKPNLKGTAWEDAEDLFGDNFFGLLAKRGGKWRVVTHALGCTDVCYSHWWKTYKAPKAIFPYTE